MSQRNQSFGQLFIDESTDTVTKATRVAPPKIVQLYNAGAAAIAAGDAVALVLSDTTHGLGCSVETLDVSDAEFQLIAGGALAAIPVGETGPVVVEGIQDNVNVVDGTTAGQYLSGGASDGRLAVLTGTFGAEVRPCALLLEAPSSNRAAVRWLNPLGY